MKHRPRSKVPPRATVVVAFTLVASAVLVGFFCWPRVAPDATAAANSRHGETVRAPALARRQRAPAASSPRFVAGTPGSEEIRNDPESKARHVLDMAVLRVLTDAKMLASTVGIEAAGSSMSGYLLAAMSTLRDIDPALLVAMQAPLADRVCKPTVEDVELMLYARVAMSAPEVATERGFACAFTHHKQEDVLLWDLIDGWRRTGMPKTAEIAAIESAAFDPRTKRRFLSEEETLARRAESLSSQPIARGQTYQRGAETTP